MSISKDVPQTTRYASLEQQEVGCTTICNTLWSSIGKVFESCCEGVARSRIDASKRKIDRAPGSEMHFMSTPGGSKVSVTKVNAILNDAQNR